MSHGLIVGNVPYNNIGEEQLIEFSTSSSLLEVIGFRYVS